MQQETTSGELDQTPTNIDHSDLINVDPMNAISIKWQRGRERYGDTYVGARPIVECHAEILDACAYLWYERASDDLDADVIDELIRTLLGVLEGVRTQIKGAQCTNTTAASSA